MQIDIDNRTGIELSNGSRIKAVTTSEDVGRSEAISVLFVDEAAHIEKLADLWVGLWPTLSTGGRAIIASTPNGAGNWFHTTWKQARDGLSNFNCRFGNYTNPQDPEETYNDRLMWWVHPHHNLIWYEQETLDKSPRDIAQEYECSFNASGETFIDPGTLIKLDSHTKEPISREYFDKNLWIWQECQPNIPYLISCDVSRGDAKDYSAVHVIRLDTLEQVAEYKGKLKPDVLGYFLLDLGKRYNNAVIAPENNSGWSGPTILRLQEANYFNLYYYKRKASKVKDKFGKFVDPFYAEMSNDYLPGYAVTQMTRLPMLAKMEQYLRQGLIKINSVRLVDELKTFIVTDTGRPEARRRRMR